MDPADSALPLYVQLYQRLRDHILSKQLTPGSLLPSSRTLAADLKLSRNTVEAAISQLRAEGFVERRVGAGTVVADISDMAPFYGRTRAASGTLRGATDRAETGISLGRRGAQIASAGKTELDSERPHAPCTVDIAHFPSALWNRLMARTIRERGNALFDMGDPQGDAALRTAISAHAHLTRGVRCSPERVVVLSSAQQGIDLAGRLLLSDGDLALVEEPGYRSARASLLSAGAKVRGIPVDREGLIVDALAGHKRARLLYLTPSHQFPLGVTMSLPRRLGVLEWARESKAWIIEDDYDSEFRHHGRPLAALQGLDQEAHVLYLGTFNKVMFPALRIAYIILPASLVEPFVAARRIADGGPATLPQGTLALFMTEGHFAAHLRRARKFYTTRRDQLIEMLRRTLGTSIEIGSSETGLHLVAHIDPAIDDVVLAQSVAGPGLGVAPLSAYYAEAFTGSLAPRGLLLSFGGATEEGIRAAGRALSKAVI